MKIARKNIIYIFIALVLFIILFFYLSHNTFSEGFRSTRIVPHQFENGYVITEIYGFLTDTECDEIINLARKRGFEESSVADTESKTGTAVNNQVRSSKTCWLEDNVSPIVNKITDDSVEITKIPKENHEDLQVAKYDINGKFDQHYDYCDFTDKDYCDKFNRNSGNRRSTLLIYLNDDFEGGETEFVRLGLKIKPVKGKALLFWNVDEKGNLYTQSEHKGNVVLKGEKIIATKWSHMYKFIK